MTQPESALTQFAELAAGGLAVLAVIYDKAIREVHEERQASVQGRENPHVLHGLIRERVVLAAESNARLLEAGVDLRVRESDSIRFGVEGASLAPKVLHKPQHGAPVADGVLSEPNAELWGDPGVPYLFYSIKNSALARLILVQVVTEESKFAYRCEWLEEYVVYDHTRTSVEEMRGVTGLGAIPAVILDPNDEDGLDDMVQHRDEELSNEVVSKSEDRDVEQGGELGAHSA